MKPQSANSCLSTVLLPLVLASMIAVQVLGSDSLLKSSIADESVQPKVYVMPNMTVKWAVGERFSADVLVENVSGMRGVYFELYWDGYYDSRVPGWLQVLNTSINDVAVYETLLPKPYKVYGLTLTAGAGRSWLKFLCILDCTTAPQNGSGKIMSINFTVLDPWCDGRQPVYTENACNWTLSNATSDVTMWWGYIISQYPSLRYLYYGGFYGSTQGLEGYALYGGMGFTFMPVPGDLDGNGKVDEKDLMIIFQFYNSSVAVYPNGYYDLNGDGVIDICDVVVVASNYGRTSPY